MAAGTEITLHGTVKALIRKQDFIGLEIVGQPPGPRDRSTIFFAIGVAARMPSKWGS